MNYPPLDFERLARYSKRLDESFIYCIDELDLITPENILGKVTGGDILKGKSRLSQYMRIPGEFILQLLEKK